MRTGLTAPGVGVLLVGTGTHSATSVLPDVPAVAATVQDLGRVLVERCGLGRDGLQLLIDPESPLAVDNALTEVAARATDVLLLYYVGHGVVSPSGELHLATTATKDLTHGLAAYQAMPYSAVLDLLTACRARSIVVVLDCCFSGRARGFSDRRADGTFELSYVHGGYLLTSSARNEAALAPAGQRYTAFTGELLRLLRDGDPAGPADITLDHAYHYLSRALPARGFPLPHRQAGDRAGELVLAPNPSYQSPSVRLRRAPTPGFSAAAPEESCPYRGLASYGAADARYFFGRDRLTDELVGQMAERLHRPGPVMVVGPSGSGKSSLLRAGMLPALADGALPLLGSREWPALVLSPGVHPLGELSTRLAGLVGVPDGALHDELAVDPGNFAFIVRRASAGNRLILVVDQFEEVFTTCGEEQERHAFVQALSAACGQSPDVGDAAALVVLCVRADFYGQCASHPELIAAMRDGQVVVGAMSRDELREAIEKPAETAGLVLEQGLVELILHDLGAEAESGYTAGRLPLLSHALLETWQQREAGVLTLAGYQATGGIRDSVARTAERTYLNLTAVEQEVARTLLLRMVHIGRGTEDTRRRARLVDLQRGQAAQSSTINRVLGRLVDARLVTADADAAEITHEALLQHWPRLREWIDADREGLLIHQQLTEAADAWEGERRDPSSLYSGARLVRAREWVATGHHRGELTEREDAFMKASTQRARRRTRRLYQVIAGLMVLLIAAASAGLVALQQRNEALRQQRLATGRELTAEANALRDSRPRLSLLLSVEALRLDPSGDARASLLKTLSESHLAGGLIGQAGYSESVALSPNGHTMATVSADRTAILWNLSDLGHPARLATLSARPGFITAVAFGPDGRTLATASEGAAILWDISDRTRPARLATLTDFTAPVSALAFGPDGQTLATASARAVILWDLSDGTHPARLATLTDFTPSNVDYVNAVAFSPDGHTLVTASDNSATLLVPATSDRTAILWDLSDRAHPARLASLIGHTDSVFAVAFSPDGRTLATAGADHTAILWDVSDRAHPARLATLTGHTDSVFAVAFSPDGRTLATASADSTVILWELSDRAHPTRLATLAGHTNVVYTVAFGADGHYLATVSGDHTAILWNLSDRAHPARLAGLGHNAWVEKIAFSPDGHTLATATPLAIDRTAILWDVSDRAHPARVATLAPIESTDSMAFSPDGRTLATATRDHTAILWDVSDRAHPARLASLIGHTDGVESVAFSPDGHTLATASDDHTAILWDVSDRAHPTRLATLIGHSGSAESVAFSPDGHTLATASADHTAILWDVSDRARPARLATLIGHSKQVTAAAFAPDGHTLATASDDHTAILWDVSDRAHPARLATLTGHSKQVTAAAFAPDGHIVATSGFDGIAILWDVSDRAHPAHLATLTGHTDIVAAVAFSPDGHTVGTASFDRTAILWDVSDVTYIADHAVALACAIAGPGLSTADWARYVPGMPYERTCH